MEVEVGVPLPLAPSGGGNHFHDDGGCGGDGDGRDDYLDLTVLKRRLHHQYIYMMRSRDIVIVRKSHAAMKQACYILVHFYLKRKRMVATTGSIDDVMLVVV